VLSGRLLQGFSAGVELGGVSVYLAEMATPGHKGFYVSWQSAQPAGRGHRGGGARLLPSTYHADACARSADWGWRVPFFVGCMIVPVLFAIRRSPAGNRGVHGSASTAPAPREIFASMIEKLGPRGPDRHDARCP
jgi:MHS family citrate/tricarballylate:H+ symporter-like MFS transporter